MAFRKRVWESLVYFRLHFQLLMSQRFHDSRLWFVFKGLFITVYSFHLPSAVYDILHLMLSLVISPSTGGSTIVWQTIATFIVTRTYLLDCNILKYPVTTLPQAWFLRNTQVLICLTVNAISAWIVKWLGIFLILHVHHRTWNQISAYEISKDSVYVKPPQEFDMWIQHNWIY